MAQRFFDEAVVRAGRLDLLSDEHFAVDGTPTEAAAGPNSVRPEDRPTMTGSPDDPGKPAVDLRRERRSNATHRSTADPDARLMRKGKGKAAKLA